MLTALSRTLRNVSGVTATIGGWEEFELLVTVKAYPSVSTKYGEAVCVAGIRLDTPTPQWVRLFPVAFRDLPSDQRFQKFHIIKLRVQRHSTDRRRESYRPDLGSIVVGRRIDAGRHWAARRAFVEPLLGPSMCELIRGREGGASGPSLGIVRPAHVLDVVVRDAEQWSPSQVATLNQGNLLSTKTVLEKPAHSFAYKWLCEQPGCRGHTQSIADWEIGQAYRGWRRQGYDVIDSLREKWLDYVCAEHRETLFFVGDQHRWPGSFMVLGAFYPEYRPVAAQLTLEGLAA